MWFTFLLLWWTRDGPGGQLWSDSPVSRRFHRQVSSITGKQADTLIFTFWPWKTCALLNDTSWTICIHSCLALWHRNTSKESSTIPGEQRLRHIWGSHWFAMVSCSSQVWTKNLILKRNINLVFTVLYLWHFLNVFHMIQYEERRDCGH